VVPMTSFENMVCSMGAFHICPIFIEIFFCEIFCIFLDALSMIRIALSIFGRVKSYGLVCRLLHCNALAMLQIRCFGHNQQPFVDFSYMSTYSLHYTLICFGTSNTYLLHYQYISSLMPVLVDVVRSTLCMYVVY
jgi:hypothetical protein